PPIYIKLEVPQGIHGGYIGNFLAKEGANDFLIERGQGIQINKASIINQKGKEFVKLEAELVTQQGLTKELERYNKELNNELKEIFITVEDHDLVQLNLKGRFFTQNYNESKRIIDAMKNFPTDFLDLLNLRSKELSKTPNIRILDDYINGEEKTTEGIHYFYGEHETYISLRAAKNPRLTALHEIGHALDDLIFDDISKEREFNDLFDEESKNFPENWYGRKDEHEYFAECFALFYYPNDVINNALKLKAPKTYEFIKNLDNHLPDISF
ncbi:anthrax toxin lethal factor-related metalloendopeptidase, partial [Bacillus cereus]|uniref:anthrax toxin lethal factor-related metalloendopeptidase n=1 Tax=Bacillus cereus TaxID=1396 RepID=UPI00311A9CB8